jgi:hypothetical protein
MLRQSVIGLGVYAAVSMSAGTASAEAINLHCSVVRQGDPPWTSNIAKNYSINLRGSTVNGEILQIDRINPKGPQLTWNRPADASVPAARYDLDSRTGRLFVSFDKVEYDGRKFASATVLLLCTHVRLKLAV